MVGRGSNCDIPLLVEGISRQHCQIEVDDMGAIYITDLGSTNGVLINNERITPHKKTPFAPYLTLVIGGIPTLIETDASGVASLGAYRAVKKESTRSDNEVTVELQTPQRFTGGKPRLASRLSKVRSVAEEPERPSQRMLIILLGVLALAGLTYLFMVE